MTDILPWLAMAPFIIIVLLGLYALSASDEGKYILRIIVFVIFLFAIMLAFGWGLTEVVK